MRILQLSLFGMCFVSACTDPPDVQPTQNAWAVTDWDHPDLMIGAMDAPAHEVFGSLTDVAVAGEVVYVLDALDSRIRAYDINGGFRGEAGGEGDGPGELRNPLSLAATMNGTLYVGQVNHTVVVYPRVPMANPAEAEQIRIDVAARDMCLQDSVLVVPGGHPEHESLVWVYGHEGELKHAFGKRPQISNPLLRHELSRGHIACMPQGQVIYAPVSDSTIIGFDSSGSESWRQTIPGFKTTGIETTQSGGYSVRVPEEGWNYVVGLVQWNPTTALLQVAYQTPASRSAGDPWERLDSYEIQLTDPVNMERLPYPLPRIMEVSESVIVGKHDMPYPKLLLWYRE